MIMVAHFRMWGGHVPSIPNMFTFTHVLHEKKVAQTVNVTSDKVNQVDFFV